MSRSVKCYHRLLSINDTRSLCIVSCLQEYNVDFSIIRFSGKYGITPLSFPGVVRYVPGDNERYRERAERQ